MNQSHEVEQAILGTIFASAENGQARPAFTALLPDYFQDSTNRSIFEAARALQREGVIPTPQNMKLSGLLPQGIGEADLMKLALGYSPAVSHQLLSRKLVESYGIGRVRELGAMAQDPTVDAFALLNHLEQVSADIGRAVTCAARPSKEEQVNAVNQYYQDKREGRIRPISTGFSRLDRALGGGLSDGGLSYLVAPGGFGKTSFALSIGIYAARCGFPARFFQGEMTEPQMHRRGTLITQGVAPEQDEDAWVRWVKEYVYDIPLRIDVLADRSPARILAECEQAALDGSRLVIIDYLQVFSENASERIMDPQKEFLAIRHLSRRLRAFALRTGVHILAISSRNRNEDNKMRSSLSSLYGGTGLEHDCTEAFVIRRYSDSLTEYEDTAKKQRLEQRERETGICLVDLDILKARDGITGPIPFTYNKTKQQFTEDYDCNDRREFSTGTRLQRNAP